MKFLNDLAELFYPSDIKCIICDRELNEDTRYMICDKCKVDYNNDFCERCGRPLDCSHLVCNNCNNCKINFSQARSSLEFKDSTKKIVYNFKYNNARYLAAPMAEFLADTYYNAKWEVDYATFVPIHVKRRRMRGYNQAELLCKSLCAIIEVECANLLSKDIYTKNMAKLNRENREKLIQNTFSLCSNISLKGKRVLLIDDVLTTGATTNECAKLLHDGGAEVYVLTFASVRIKETLIFQK